MMMMMMMVMMMIMKDYGHVDNGDDDDEDDNDGDDANSDRLRRDSELGQMSMTCGKLSNQAPSVKSRLNGSSHSYAQ